MDDMRFYVLFNINVIPVISGHRGGENEKALVIVKDLHLQWEFNQGPLDQ